MAAPAGGALHVGRPSDPPHFPESFGISVKAFLLLLCRSSNGDFGIEASEKKKKKIDYYYVIVY